MKLEIKYSIEKDAQTYVDYIFNFKSFRHGRGNIQENLLSKLDLPLQVILNSAKNDQEAFSKTRDYLEQIYSPNKEVIVDSITKLKNVWDRIGDSLIYSLEFLYKKPFPFKEAAAYITTNFIFPYNYKQKYFFVNYKYLSSQLNTIKHELNHFMFYYYYPVIKNLDLEKYELLKESITFFSNPEQEGKPNEKPLRDLYKSKIWNSLDEAIVEATKLL